MTTTYSKLYTNGLGLEEEDPFPQPPAAASAAVVVCFARSRQKCLLVSTCR